jgi:hypothetical protein
MHYLTILQLTFAMWFTRVTEGARFVPRSENSLYCNLTTSQMAKAKLLSWVTSDFGHTATSRMLVTKIDLVNGQLQAIY